MQFTPVTPRTRPDGSIDTAFYTDRARILRSQQAHRLAKTAAQTEIPAPVAPKSLLARLNPFAFVRQLA